MSCVKPAEHKEGMENEEDAHYQMSDKDKENSKVEKEPVEFKCVLDRPPPLRLPLSPIADSGCVVHLRCRLKRTHTDLLAFAMLVVMWVSTAPADLDSANWNPEPQLPSQITVLLVWADRHDLKGCRNPRGA